MTTPSSRRRSPAVVALASFVFPGLGHLILGRRRSALVYAVPVLLLLVIVGLRLLSEGLDVLAIEMFSPTLSLTVLGIIVVLGLWWSLALADAFSAAGGRRPWRPLPASVAGGLLAVVMLVTGFGAYSAWSLYDSGQKIFVTGGVDGHSTPPAETAGPGGSDAAPTPLGSDPGFADATPLTTPPPNSPRITVLLTGIDSSPTRDHALNDTMIVASLDTSTGKLAMVSFARDIAGFRMWNGQTFPGKLNSLMSTAQGDPRDYPLGGVNTLVKELSFLLGINIDYYAAVNLPGFTALVDAAGGVTVHNDTAIVDTTYGGWTDHRPIGFTLGVGTFTLDGQSALAFARSRMGPNNSDFARARRQQLLILALEKKLTSPSMLPRLPGIIRALGNTVRTNYPAEGLSKVLDVAKGVSESDTTRVVLGPPYAVRSSDPSTYSLTLDMAKIKALSLSLFGSDSAYWTPPPGASPSAPPSPGGS
jgi:polyisoprenyl-teichoic acid--peptidoglycan teichoic acid transferase